MEKREQRRTMMFADRAKIYVKSGKGGDGHVSFRREKYVPNGGPDGGDGGNGGSVYFEVDEGLNTLTEFRHIRKYCAKNGEEGGKKNCAGKNGEDITIKVPEGTVIREAESGKVITDMSGENRRFLLLKGGRGGSGNQHYATSTMQAPKYAQPGQPGIEKAVVLELKLLGDVGLVGFPNAGKSTLLSALSAAKPKIADYPFTTMEPQLGIVSYRDGKSFVMADIPGIIEGASEGKGLGLRFLRHIERNAVLLFMVPADSDDIKRDYEVLLREVREFNPELADKSRVLAISKSDMLDDELREALMAEPPEGVPTLFISAVTGQGLPELKDLLWREINSEQNLVAQTITHRPLDIRHRDEAEDNFIFEPEEMPEDENMPMTDEDWNEEFWDEEDSVNG